MAKVRRMELLHDRVRMYAVPAKPDTLPFLVAQLGLPQSRVTKSGLD